MLASELDEFQQECPEFDFLSDEGYDAGLDVPTQLNAIRIWRERKVQPR